MHLQGIHLFPLFIVMKTLMNMIKIITVNQRLFLKSMRHLNRARINRTEISLKQLVKNGNLTWVTSCMRHVITADYSCK